LFNYPHAANLPGEPRFAAAPGTPTVNGLSPALLAHNPNQADPKRLVRSEPMILNNSQTDHDALTGQGQCGTGTPALTRRRSTSTPRRGSRRAADPAPNTSPR
jgi:hypothetical protein